MMVKMYFRVSRLELDSPAACRRLAEVAARTKERAGVDLQFVEEYPTRLDDWLQKAGDDAIRDMELRVIGARGVAR